jgi:hypothetical protein
MRLLLNALGFQTAWWACVAGVGFGLEIPALVYCLVLVGLHLAFAPKPWSEIKLAAIALKIGLLVDTLLQTTAVIGFNGLALGHLSPFWLWMLWVMFALTLNTSLAILQTQPLWLSALAGLVFGPLTYIAGAKLGAAVFDGSIIHVGALALAWFIALPLLVYAAKKIFIQQQGLS